MPDPDALAAASVWDPHGRQVMIPTGTVTELGRSLRSFTSVAGYTGSGVIPTTANGVKESVMCEVITGSYFSILGARPWLGRLISEDDIPETGEPARVVVISHRFWQRRFGGDPNVVGQTILIRDLPVRIIGVTPPEFTGLRVDRPPEVIFPLLLMRLLDTPPNPTRTVAGYYMVGRLTIASFTIAFQPRPVSKLSVSRGPSPRRSSARWRSLLRARRTRRPLTERWRSSRRGSFTRSA